MDIIKPHHSLSDWDYRPGAYLELASDQYVSAPSSLRIQENPPDSRQENLYLKATLAPNVPDGKIIDWRRATGGTTIFTGGYLFRCQDTPFDTFPLNCYRIHFSYPECTLFSIVAGTPTVLLNFPWFGTNPLDTWHRFRVTFYQYIEDDLHKYLRVIFEKQEAGEWIEKWRYAHWDNLWADTGINRLGIYTWAINTDNYNWIDNTEIWEKTS